jgi:hypothetical protein
MSYDGITFGLTCPVAPDITLVRPGYPRSGLRTDASPPIYLFSSMISGPLVRAGWRHSKLRDELAAS